MKTRAISPILPALAGALVLACSTGGAGDPARPRSVERSVKIAESTSCHVDLVQISYDDPSADDEERITLRVVGAPDAGMSSPAPPADAASTVPPEAPATGSCGGESHSAEAGTSLPPDGGSARSDGATAPGASTLGNCGLDHIELVNGSSPACSVYRSLPLADVPIPIDGYVTICSDDSILGAAGGCDVTTAGGATLRNGWIQNGPDDAMRFVARDGRSAEVSYEGRACVTAGAWSLADESGAMDDGSGEEVDDVNVWCGGGFVLQPRSRVDPRREGPCPADSPEDAGGRDARASGGPVPARADSATRGSADAASAAASESKQGQPSGTVTETHVGTVDPPALLLDSGGSPHLVDAGEGGRRPPVPASCALVPARPPPGPPAAPAVAAFAVGLAALRRLAWHRRSTSRRRGRSRAPKAGARSGSGRPG